MGYVFFKMLEAFVEACFKMAFYIIIGFGYVVAWFFKLLAWLLGKLVGDDSDEEDAVGVDRRAAGDSDERDDVPVAGGPPAEDR